MDWSVDRRLQLRMAITLDLLLLTGPIAAVIGGDVVILAVLGISAPIVGSVPHSPFTTITLVLLETGIVLLVILWGERKAPEHAIASIRARPIETGASPKIRRLIKPIAQQIDVPQPSIYVAPTDTPLSMTTGFRPSSARLVLSEGLLELRSEEELRAVIAHELAHVKNRDTT